MNDKLIRVIILLVITLFAFLFIRKCSEVLSMCANGRAIDSNNYNETSIRTDSTKRVWLGKGVYIKLKK